jgi:hypothetical protein
VKVGFPSDVTDAVATLRHFTAGDPTQLEEALAVARQQSRIRRSKLLVVELLVRALVCGEPGVLSLPGSGQLVAVGAD